MNHQLNGMNKNSVMKQNYGHFGIQANEEVKTTSHQMHPAKPKEEKIKRPMNAFMVWSKMERRNINKRHPDLHNSEISKQLGYRWGSMTEEEKAPYRKQAEQIKLDHMKANPGYVYRPERKQTAVKRRSENDENGSKQPEKKKQQRPMSPQYGQTNQNTWEQRNQFHPTAGQFYNNPYGMTHNGYIGNGVNHMPNMPPMAEQMVTPTAHNAMTPMQINFNIHYPNFYGAYPIHNNSYGNSSTAHEASAAPPNVGFPQWNAPTMAFPQSHPFADSNTDNNLTNL